MCLQLCTQLITRKIVPGLPGLSRLWHLDALIYCALARRAHIRWSCKKIAWHLLTPSLPIRRDTFAVPGRWYFCVDTLTGCRGSVITTVCFFVVNLIFFEMKDAVNSTQIILCMVVLHFGASSGRNATFFPRPSEIRLCLRFFPDFQIEPLLSFQSHRYRS